jgi:CDP-diacylglycerol--serine O-phosphatidyltransferase
MSDPVRLDQRPDRSRVTPMQRWRRRLQARQRPRFKGMSFNKMIPNLMTMAGLCCGLASMRFAMEGRFGAAAVAICVAGIIDGLDGRLARLLKATSRFGAEFDSLSDFLCFGVAPAFVLYIWSMQAWGAAGFVPCVAFAVCMALRLARFNAALDSAPKPAYAYNFFTGVPAPAGAGLVLFPLFLGLQGQALEWDMMVKVSQFPGLCGFFLLGTALLCISTLPVWSFKNFKMPQQVFIPLMVGAGLYVTLLLSEPWAALAAAGVIYLGMLPFSVRSYHKLRREAEALAGEDEAV